MCTVRAVREYLGAIAEPEQDTTSRGSGNGADALTQFQIVEMGREEVTLEFIVCVIIE